MGFGREVSVPWSAARASNILPGSRCETIWKNPKAQRNAPVAGSIARVGVRITFLLSG